MHFSRNKLHEEAMSQYMILLYDTGTGIESGTFESIDSILPLASLSYS